MVKMHISLNTSAKCGPVFLTIPINVDTLWKQYILAEKLIAEQNDNKSITVMKIVPFDGNSLMR